MKVSGNSKDSVLGAQLKELFSQVYFKAIKFSKNTSFILTLVELSILTWTILYNYLNSLILALFYFHVLKCRFRSILLTVFRIMLHEQNAASYFGPMKISPKKKKILITWLRQKFLNEIKIIFKNLKCVLLSIFQIYFCFNLTATFWLYIIFLLSIQGKFNTRSGPIDSSPI